MAVIDQFKHHFNESERAHGRQLYELGHAVGRSIVSKRTADVEVESGDDSEYVKIRMLEMDKRLKWSCTCEIYDSNINCRHIWAALLLAEERSFFHWRFGESVSDSKNPIFEVSDTNVKNHSNDHYVSPTPVERNVLGTSRFPEQQKREALFVLKTPDNEFEDWSIKLHYRNCYNDGSRGRWKPEDSVYYIEYADYEPKFRKALRAYSAAHEKARYEFVGNTFSSEIWSKALSEISKTKAFRYLDEKERSHHLEFAASSFRNPIQFEMKGILKSGNLKISGSFVSRGLRIPVSSSTRATNKFAIVDGRLYCAELHGSHVWIEQIKKHQPLVVEEDDINAFLSSLYSPEAIPRLAFPPRYSYKIIEEAPAVRLIIEKAGDSNLCAELEFKYGDEYVDRSEQAHRLLDHEKKVIHARQTRDEREFRNKLFGVLGRKHYSPGGLLLFKESKLSSLVNAAFDLKWEVVAFKKQVSQMTDYKLKATSGIDWFDLHLDMKFTGGATIPLPDLLRGVKSGKKMISLADGSLGVLNEDVIERFSQLGLGLKIVNGKVRATKTQALYLSSLLSDDRNFSADQKFKTLRKVRELSTKPVAQAPDNRFQGKLRGYQKKGLGWLDELSKREIGCLLADDMGLGKTVSILALLSKRLKGQALIVVPKTLISNWLLEAEKFVPHLKVFEHYGAGRNDSRLARANADVILTTYHTLRSDIDRFKKTTFDFLVVDEAQWIKNPNSDIHRACRLVSARRKIALTGTPIENSIGDLFSIFNVVTPGLISKGGWEKFADADDAKVMRGIRQAVAPFILRRKKEDVLKELPKKVTQVLYSTLNSKERRDYNHLKKYLWKTIKGEIDKNGIRRASPQILTALLCCPGSIVTDGAIV